MNRTRRFRHAIALPFLLVALGFIAPPGGAVEALLLQDTYVDNGTNGGKPPNASNYGSGIDLRVFKGIGRTFLKFTLATLPPGTAASDITQAWLRFWVNSNSTLAGSITLSPVTTAWDEYTLNDNSTGSLTFGAPKLSDPLGDGIAAGHNSANLALEAHAAWIWGDQFASGSDFERNYPRRLSELSSISPVSAGSRHLVALRSDGTIWTWGENGLGQLGDGTVVDRTTPAVVPYREFLIPPARSQDLLLAPTPVSRLTRCHHIPL